MANEFLTPKQVVDRMIASADSVVARMSIESVRKIAEQDLSNVGFMGLSGALGASLLWAAKKRVDAEGGMS